MRRILFPLLIYTLVINVVAQSGRKVSAPAPPPPAPVVEEPSSSRSGGTTSISASARAELGTLSDSILNRKLQAIDKGSFRLADFAGKIVVVNLWATWCGPCRREVPEYEEVRRAFANRNVEFIGLTAEDPHATSDRVKQFARDFHFGFRLGWIDRETAAQLMNGRGVIPQTFVIAKDGRVLSHWRGYSPGRSGERLRDALERALSEESGR
ncbi:MAG: TlpA family protein disulfide reductase [Acidobacteriota bacterium]|nr:TlpA family protein disulfide reductase [Acidobacteriota bacterium]